MKYCDGQVVKIGDKVKLGSDEEGTVVCSIDDGEYSVDYPKGQWGYLEQGAMIYFPSYGLIHYVEPEIDLHLISRSQPGKSEQSE